MSVNSSSFPNDSDLLHHQSSTNSSITEDEDCFFFEPYSFIITTFAVTNILLILPLCIFILLHGLQQWRSTSSVVTVSHSDCFTYHMVLLELVGVSGSVLLLCGVHKEDFSLLLVGWFFFYFIWYGQTFFHVLTCVERYLAVVHPITYLSLRNQRGIRIRNISIACVWLLSFGGMILSNLDSFEFVDFCLVILALMVISFCSLSVLCVLIRPGPGAQGGVRERVDHSKQRAFYTITVILGVLVLRFSEDVVTILDSMFGDISDCEMLLCELWFSLPISLVLPLLFLYKHGGFIGFKKTVQ